MFPPQRSESWKIQKVRAKNYITLICPPVFKAILQKKTKQTPKPGNDKGKAQEHTPILLTRFIYLLYIYMPLDDFWAHVFGILGLKLLVLWVSAWSFGLEPPGLVPGG